MWGVLVNFPRVSPGMIFLDPAELFLVTDTIIMVKEKAGKLPQESKIEDAVSLPQLGDPEFSHPTSSVEEIAGASGVTCPHLWQGLGHTSSRAHKGPCP